MDTNDLIGNTDACDWADAWMSVIADHPEIPHDRETMVGWFANAIMVGWDEAARRGPDVPDIHLSWQRRVMRWLSRPRHA